MEQPSSVFHLATALHSGPRHPSTLKHTINLVKHRLTPGFGATWSKSFCEAASHTSSDSSIILIAAWLWASLQHKTCSAWADYPPLIAVDEGGSTVLLFCSSSHVARSTIKALNVRCYFIISAGRKEMFPEIPWKRTLCWRDRLLHVCLSECLLQNSISLHLAFGKENLQKCSFYISKAACSTPAHLSIPSLQGESFLPSASHLVASSVGLRPPEESLQDNTNPIWKLAGGKGNLLCCEFLFLFNSSTSVHYQNISIATETPRGIYKKRGKAGCKIYRVPAQFTVIQNGRGPSQWRWMISNTLSFCQILISRIYFHSPKSAEPGITYYSSIALLFKDLLS